MMRPPKRSRRQSAKAQGTSSTTPKRQKTSSARPNQTQRRSTSATGVSTSQSRFDDPTGPSSHSTEEVVPMNTTHRNNFQSEQLVEVHLGAHGPETTPLTPSNVQRLQTRQPTVNVESNLPIPSNSQVDIQPALVASQPALNLQNQAQNGASSALGTFNELVNTFHMGSSQGLMGLGNVQGGQEPSYTTSVCDPVCAHIPVKLKEKIWAGQFIDLSILLKSAQDLAADAQQGGDLVIKGGQLTVVQHKSKAITNIHIWTSAFMIYMSVLLEKWPQKGQELLKYMSMVRLAASRGSGLGWVSFDEQYRLRKARSPESSWAIVDMELWVIYVSTQPSFDFSSNMRSIPSPMQQFGGKTDFNTQHFQGTLKSQNSPNFQGNTSQRPFRTCWRFNKAVCQYGRQCKFAHKCSNCFGDHPVKFCRGK